MHYICAAKPFWDLLQYAPGILEVHARPMGSQWVGGPLPWLTIHDWMTLLTEAAKLRGDLRLFHVDGREICPDLITPEQVQDIYPSYAIAEIQPMLEAVRNALSLPLKKRSNLFQISEAA